MSKFGRIDYSETSFGEITFYKNQTLTSASDGVSLVHILKDQTESDISVIDGGVLTVTGSHWAFIHNMFYMSGSTKVAETMAADIPKFDSIYHNFNQYNDLKPFHTNKFYDSGSVFYIPQQNFGERIKPGSFQLTARTGSLTNTNSEIIIKDDGNGNLYSTNAVHSQSAGSLSSSDNYVGNLFYDLGVVTLTETASWSGSVNYTDIGQVGLPNPRNYKYWDLKFNSTLPIYTAQYTIKLKAGELNSTMNASARGIWTGSAGIEPDSQPFLKNELTGSGWSPYLNQVQLYRKQGEEPILIANLPRSVKTRDDIDLIITFRIDH